MKLADPKNTGSFDYTILIQKLLEQSKKKKKSTKAIKAN